MLWIRHQNYLLYFVYTALIADAFEAFQTLLRYAVVRSNHTVRNLRALSQFCIGHEIAVVAEYLPRKIICISRRRETGDAMSVCVYRFVCCQVFTFLQNGGRAGGDVGAAVSTIMQPTKCCHRLLLCLYPLSHLFSLSPVFFIYHSWEQARCHQHWYRHQHTCGLQKTSFSILQSGEQISSTSKNKSNISNDGWTGLRNPWNSTLTP